MTAAQAILQELHADIGTAEGNLVRSEGRRPAERVKCREQALESLTVAARGIERARKLIEAELYDRPGAIRPGAYAEAG